MDIYQAYFENELVWNRFIDEYSKIIIESKNYLESKTFFSIDDESFDEYFLGNILDGGYPPFKVENEKEDFHFDDDVVPRGKEQLINLLLTDSKFRLRDRVEDFLYRKYRAFGEFTKQFNDDTNLYDTVSMEDELQLALDDLQLHFENFTFAYSPVQTFAEGWDYKHVNIIIPSKDILIVPPTVKVVDYFDPTIYEIIKKNPDLLRSMDWRLFEEMLADILKHFGYSIELTRPTKDGGIDVIAIKHDSYLGDHKYILQAKRQTKAVQVAPVRELLFLHNDLKATKSCFATTTTFTNGAWQEAEKYKWQLELKDRNGILEWIDAVYKIRKNKDRNIR